MLFENLNYKTVSDSNLLIKMSTRNKTSSSKVRNLVTILSLLANSGMAVLTGSLTMSPTTVAEEASLQFEINLST
jgi:hypothetical protein